MNRLSDRTCFSDSFFMKEAFKEAQKALARDEVPIGAVIVCGNNIVARAHNLTETLNDVTAHAEMQAFTAASGFLGGKFLENCTLFVTLEPCIMCAGAAFWVQLGRLVFGASDTKRGYRLVSHSLLHPKTRVESGIIEEECSRILKDFFKRKRKNHV
jgi:tRNA(adenine34) deaminase